MKSKLNEQIPYNAQGAAKRPLEAAMSVNSTLAVLIVPMTENTNVLRMMDAQELDKLIADLKSIQAVIHR